MRAEYIDFTRNRAATYSLPSSAACGRQLLPQKEKPKTILFKGMITMISIAIDGPSGAGKSSLSKALAKDLGYVYVDTGAMYRSIGLYAVRAGVDPHDADAVAVFMNQKLH